MACLLPPMRASLARRLAAPASARCLSTLTPAAPHKDAPPVVLPAARSAAPPAASTSAPLPDGAPPPPKPARPRLRPTKAAITITPAAVARLRALTRGPAPQHLRIGVRNRGCAGLAYHLDYAAAPGRFDEVVEQDGVRVLVDSRALFSLVGAEMDWVEDRLSAKFAFKNPNVKDACGCGESFTV